MRTVRIAKDETVISESRLKQLLAKEQAHDAYLWAMKRMADKSRLLGGPRAYTSGDDQVWTAGYKMALSDFSQLVVDAP